MPSTPGRRRDPDDGQVYTLPGLVAKYRGDFSREEIAEYWEAECEIVRDARDAYQGLGQPDVQEERRIDPDNGAPYTLRDLHTRYSGLFAPQEIDDYWDAECQPLRRPEAAALKAPARNGTAKPATTDWAAWLRNVAPSGMLDHHLDALASNFDSLEQIAKLYVSSGVLGRQFFADVSVRDEQEMRLFFEWFAKAHRTAPRPAVATGRRVAPSVVRQSDRSALERWLREVDPRGSLLCYLDTLAGSFGDLRQLTDAYVAVVRVGTAQGTERRKTLDHQLFEELGVADERHRALFKEWFQQKLGASSDEPPPPPPPPQPPPPQDRAGSYHYWPQDVPREQQNRARRLMHSAVKSWYSRERVHGPATYTQGLAAPIQLRLLRAGDEVTYPQRGDTVTVHYISWLPDGARLDSSRERGRPFRFVAGAGQVIAGWDRGVMRMSLGERSQLHVPSSLAYGAEGKGAVIPPCADLDFEIEVLEIRPGNDEGI